MCDLEGIVKEEHVYYASKKFLYYPFCTYLKMPTEFFHTRKHFFLILNQII